MNPTSEDIERAARLLGQVDDDYCDTDHASVRDAYRNTAEVILTDHYRRLAERGAEVVEWRPIKEIRKIVSQLEESGYLCDPECEGRCRICPQDAVAQIARLLKSLPLKENKPLK